MKQRIIASTLAVAATLASIPSEAAPVYRQTRDSAPRVDAYQEVYTYVGIDMMSYSYSGTANDSGSSTRLTFGQRFEEFVSAETQLAIGDGTHEYSVGVYARGALPMGRLQLKALIGLAASQFDNSGTIENVKSISYGGGAELTLWRDWYFNADYMSYDSSLDSINLGIGTRF